MYQSKHLQNKRRRSGKALALLLSLVFLVTAAAGGVIAYLTAQTDPVVNTFTPASVDCEVTEEFNGPTKSNVNVLNTGNTDAYIRVKLVTYRVNDSGEHIGGTAEIPAFTPGKNWKEYGGYYYYTLPVAPGEKPADDLIESIPLTGSYSDADGGKQVIEVMAEAIQSAPAEAVGESWGVSISKNSVSPYSSEG